MTATSSSDRYAKAREALDAYDFAVNYPNGDPRLHGLIDALANCIVALRSLVESPPIIESPEKLAMRVYIGIQAAWESWGTESATTVEDAPTDELRNYLYTLPVYGGMGDAEVHRVIEAAEFYWGGGIRTIEGAVDRALRDWYGPVAEGGLGE